MSKIKIKLKPQNGVKVKTQTTYLFDPTLEQAMIDLSKDWAIKTDGMVEEDGVPVDYSAKAYAIGGDGTETNNAKYYAEQASASETNAASSASSASASAISASGSAGVATTKAGEAAASALEAKGYSDDASDYATAASNSATIAQGYASDASGYATTATTQAGIATTKAGISTTKAGEASASATNAYNSELNSSSNATKSQTWAEGADVQVQALGGEHSSKGWAKVAKDLVDSLGSVLRYKGSVATYADLPTTGQETGDMWNVLEDDANYAWSGTAWDRLSGVVDLTPYRTANDQDTIDSGKVDKVSDANKVYGTDSSGNQTTYSKDSFGQVDDVQVNGTSVVTNKVASVTVPTQPSDIGAATSAQGTKADTAIQGVQIDGTDLTKDINNKVNIPVAYGATKGVVYVYDAGYGIKSTNTGQLQVHCGDWAKFNNALTSPNQWLPIVVKDLLLGMKVFLGTTITGSTSNTSWNDTEKSNARNTLDIPDKTIFRDWS